MHLELRENEKMRRRLETLKGDVDSEMAATIAKMCEMAGLDPREALSDEDIMQLLREAFDEFDAFDKGPLGGPDAGSSGDPGGPRGPVRIPGWLLGWLISR